MRKHARERHEWGELLQFQLMEALQLSCSSIVAAYRAHTDSSTLNAAPTEIFGSGVQPCFRALRSVEAAQVQACDNRLSTTLNSHLMLKLPEKWWNPKKLSAVSCAFESKGECSHGVLGSIYDRSISADRWSFLVNFLQLYSLSRPINCLRSKNGCGCCFTVAFSSWCVTTYLSVISIYSNAIKGFWEGPHYLGSGDNIKRFFKHR